MRKMLLVLLVICIAGLVQADMLTQKGLDTSFETSEDDGFGSQVPIGYGRWASNWDGVDHESLFDAAEAHTGDGYWMLSGGGGSPMVGSVDGGAAVTPDKEYTFGAWIRAEAGNEPSKVEMGFDMLSGVAGAWLGNEVTVVEITTEWAYYEVTMTSWNNANAMAPKIAPFGNDTDQASGTLFTDDWTMYDPALAGMAQNPDPADGATVSPDLDVLSWENAEDAESVIVSFGIVGEPNSVIVDAEDVSSVTLSDKGIDIVSDKVYQWKVDTDNGNEVTEGLWWTFDTGNLPPVPDAGDDQYIWLEDGIATVTLYGSVEDDGKTDGYTVKWSVDLIEGDVNVTIDPNDSETTTVTFDNTGWVNLKLEADDGMFVESDIVGIGIYSSPCEAAKEDPQDSYNDYVDGMHGDINGDCKTDLEDFAILASTWLDCMSEKLGCL